MYREIQNETIFLATYFLQAFQHFHQDKSHNGEEENFKLSVTRFYGKDRLACEIAEAVILRSRKGDVCNLKSEWHDPPLIQVRRQVQRGL